MSIYPSHQVRNISGVKRALNDENQNPNCPKKQEVRSVSPDSPQKFVFEEHLTDITNPVIKNALESSRPLNQLNPVSIEIISEISGKKISRFVRVSDDCFLLSNTSLAAQEDSEHKSATEFGLTSKESNKQESNLLSKGTEDSLFQAGSEELELDRDSDSCSLLSAIDYLTKSSAESDSNQESLARNSKDSSGSMLDFGSNKFLEADDPWTEPISNSESRNDISEISFETDTIDSDQESKVSSSSTQDSNYSLINSKIRPSNVDTIMAKISSQRARFKDVCDISNKEGLFYRGINYSLVELNLDDLDMDQMIASLDESYDYANLVYKSQTMLGQCGQLESIRYLQVKHMMQIAPIIGLSKFEIGLIDYYFDYDESLFDFSNYSAQALIYEREGIVLGMINYSFEGSNKIFQEGYGYIDRLISYKNSTLMKNLFGDSLDGLQIGAPLLDAACSEISLTENLVVLDPLDEAKAFYRRNGFVPSPRSFEQGNQAEKINSFEKDLSQE